MFCRHVFGNISSGFRGISRFFWEFRRISLKSLNFAGPRPREISEALYIVDTGRLHCTAVSVCNLASTGQAGLLAISVIVAMASKTMPFESIPVWQGWMVAVQFGIGHLLPPTGFKDAAEHAGICSTEGLFLVIVRIIGVGFNGVVELPVTSF